MKKIAILMVIFITLFISKVNANNKSVINIEELTLSKTIDYLDKEVITSKELVELYLDRINTYNSSYNALITINQNIIEEAIESDNLRKENKKRGILEGIPIIIKDNIDVYNLPTTAGAKALSDNYPNGDSDVVKKLKEQGALIIAKANMSEFAFSAKDSNSSYGYVNNAYKLGYTSYGSSGGSAVGVALNFGTIALGTDTNSSVRLPASAAGLVGLRPTKDLLSSNGVIAYDITRDTVGIISKTVEDNKIILNILTNSNYEEELKDSITIGIPNSFYLGNPNSRINVNKIPYEPIKNNMEELIKKLEEHNIKIVYLDDFYGTEESYFNNTSIAGYTMCKAFNEYIKNTKGTIRDFKSLSYSNNKIQNLSGYLKSCNYSQKNFDRTLKYKNRMKEYVSKVYEENNLDYIMYPSTKNEIYIKGNNDRLINVSSTLSSVTGFPAITVPLFYENNLPYGLELLAKENEEGKLFALSSLIENINNLVNKYSTEALPLYNVDKDTKFLVDLYLKNYNNKEKEKWLNDTKEFFRKYNELENPNPNELINSFPEEESDSSLKRVKIINSNKHLLIYYFICPILIIIIIIINKYYNKAKKKKTSKPVKRVSKTSKVKTKKPTRKKKPKSKKSNNKKKMKIKRKSVKKYHKKKK